MNISVSIMTHPSRIRYAEKLSSSFCRQDFQSVSIIVDDGSGEWETGRKSLLSHADSDWHLVVQDDAIVGEQFYANVAQSIEHCPEPTLISFYTGTVRPFPNKVTSAVKDARNKSASWIKSDRLMWGVAIAIPTDLIAPMLDTVRVRDDLPYDERIGYYFNKSGVPVYYTNPSLVDHNYLLPSLLGNDFEPEPRKAHVYTDSLVTNWNEKVVKL